MDTQRGSMVTYKESKVPRQNAIPHKEFRLTHNFQPQKQGKTNFEKVSEAVAPILTLILKRVVAVVVAVVVRARVRVAVQAVEVVVTVETT